MNHLNRFGLALGAAALVSASAQAQDITPLVVEGDILPHGTVTSTFNVDVNDSGDWLVECDTDNADTLMDNAIVHNGAVIHQEGTDMGFPASHVGLWVYDSFVDSMDINDNGDRLIIFNVAHVAGVLPDKKLVVWTSGTSGMTYALMEDDVTPNTVAGEPGGAVWDSIAEVWQNNNNEIMISGRSDSDGDDMLAMITHDGAGTLGTQTLFAIDAVNHAVAFPPSDGMHLTPVQGFATSSRNMALNNAGQKMFYVDDDHTVSGGDTTLDSHFYLDFTEIAFEGDDAPTAGAFPYNHLSSAEVDINDNGDWVAAWDDDNPDSGFDGFILVNGAIHSQEGDLAPGDPGTNGGFVLEGNHFENGGVQISDAGDITWTAEWNDPDSTKDNGLYRNNDLIVQEGVTMIGGNPVTDVRTSQGGDDMAVSDNGVYIIKGLHTGTVEGVYMIEVPVADYFCFGDGTDVTCPCGNIGAAGEGCANSSNGGTTGSVIEITGSISVAANDMVLNSTGSPADKPGVFFQGDALENAGAGVAFGDGVRCVGGTIQRFAVEITDANGSASTAYSTIPANAASAGQTLYYQWWHRDPNGAGPCAGNFNVSNAAEVTWVL